MNITTSPKIWAHRNFLTVVHQANEIIEGEQVPNRGTCGLLGIGRYGHAWLCTASNGCGLGFAAISFHFRRYNRPASAAARVSAVMRRPVATSIPGA